ncbi:hypothetical protein SIL82_10045 [Sphingomonas echinoides]|uniref:Uncharacterized protein n=2 Tax=Sphingomonas echinoides TaxID=59803 RepID=A0ABU4PKU9_9SPHN|nr:hypothetical protein [Sphingomonas echinoides]MDX5984604.1 hypothetical protein [Sphingomonas echinoides]
MKEIDDTRISLAVTLLALPSIGVFFLSDMLGWIFAWQGEVPILAALDSAGQQTEATSRLFVIAAALAGFGLSYLIVLRFIEDLRTEFGPEMLGWILRWYGGGILVGALWVTGGYLLVPTSAQPGGDLLPKAVGLFGSMQGVPDNSLLYKFQVLAVCDRIAFMVAAGIVVTGGISSLVESIKPLTGEEAYAFLLHQRLRLRSYVNAAAGLLVISLLFQIAWMRWTLIAATPAVADAMSHQVDAWAVFTGVSGSIVIALFAIPAATILDARATGTPQTPSDGKTAPLLDAGLLPALGKVLVVLAPTLAGALPTILDFAGKATGLSPS